MTEVESIRNSRATGYHNVVDQWDRENDPAPAPPGYDRACSPPTTIQRSSSHRHLPGTESLPHYECSLRLESPAHIKYEKTTPFETQKDDHWTAIFVVLEGTRLAIHQAQTPNIFSKAVNPAYEAVVTPGRLLRAYTMQYAEVGIASDLQKYELVSRSPMTALLPKTVQARMKQTEPHLFLPVRQYIIRIRVECDQLLLRFKTWDDRARWIDQLCAAIDIAPPLDDRTEPKYHTLPRRRRRRQTRAQQEAAQVQVATLVQQQERIIRERFPNLLGSDEAEYQEQEHGQDNSEVMEDPEVDEPEAEDPDADDLDTSAVAANVADNMQRPSNTRDDLAMTPRPTQLPAESHFDASEDVATPSYPESSQTRPSSTVFSIDETSTKLDPASQLDPTQEARYRRRCMPSLLDSSKRASDVIVYEGAFWKIDWDAKILRQYPEPPPNYATAPAAGTPDRTSHHEAAPQEPISMEVDSGTTENSTTVIGNVNLQADKAESGNLRSGKIWKDVRSWRRRARARKNGSVNKNSSTDARRRDGCRGKNLKSQCRTGSSLRIVFFRLLGIRVPPTTAL